MQDSGYKNAAYAIAELIDNSVQAGAGIVELICIQSEEFVAQRTMKRLSRLAVIDNGSGMDPNELRRALQFGNGGHLNDREGIGRFGMGLPNSSISQGERVEVWTWQDGVANAIYSYLDLTEIISGELREVPEPVKRGLPNEWMKTCSSIGQSGTAVVWAKPNRCTWKTAKSVVRNTEEIVGRLYRKFLNKNLVKIRMTAFEESDFSEPILDILARPNDPLYLMERTSCPDPFSKVAMFEPWGEHNQQEITIDFGGAQHIVTLTYSLAKKEARQGDSPGSKPHGKHAARNLGVSIVRADRELELDSKWMPAYDPVARWMGVEVDFPPALDEVFGVTNNKQSATHLADLAGIEQKQLAELHGFSSYQELKQAWKEESDAREPLLVVKDAIETTVSALFKLLRAQSAGTRGRRRHEHPNSPESKATQATKERQKSGHKGKSDEDEALAPNERQEQVTKGLIESGVDETLATDLAASTVNSGLKYVFGHADTASGSFFNVKPKGGAILITLNTAHPAYEHLVALLESDVDTSDIEALRRQHSQAFDGLKLLLIAWARFEDEATDGEQRNALQDIREDWGRVARRFLQD
jgi:hypothetical protein